MDSLTNSYEQFKSSHSHYQAWDLTRQLSQMIENVKASDSFKKKLLEFWEAVIVEFHIYYVTPLLSVTACNQGEFQEVHGLDYRSLTGNGLCLDGIRGNGNNQLSSFDRILYRATRKALSVGRIAFSQAQWVKSLAFSDKHSNHPKDYAVFVTAPFYFDALRSVLGDRAVYLAHHKKVYDWMKAQIGESDAWWVKDEVNLSPDLYFINECVRHLETPIRSLRYECSEHGTKISGNVFWDLWLNLLSTRWPAYRCFLNSAENGARKLKAMGVKGFVLGHERNMRERVWCMSLRRVGIPSVVVESCLFDTDPSFTYRIESDWMLVDSESTCQELYKLSHPDGKIKAAGHAGVSVLRKRRLTSEERSLKKKALGISASQPVLFYATHDVGDVSAGTNKVISHLMSDVKSKEFEIALAAAKRNGFFMIIKPHRDENEDFYRQRIKKGDPAIVLENRYSSHELLTFVDAVMTRWSTVGYEAMACGTPTFYLNLYPFEPPLACFKEPQMPVAREAGTAAEKIDAFLKKAMTSEYQRWCMDWCSSQGWDASSDQRILKTIETLVN